MVGALPPSPCRLEFEPLVRDEIVLAVPPGHPFAGKAIPLERLRGEQYIAMQEGAGVRHMIEEELRAAGLRMRDLESKLELGLQESVKSAVAAGYGVTFISRTAIEGELAAGTLAAATREGLEPARQIYVVRARGGSEPGRRRVPRLRPVALVIVRWGLDELAGRARRGRRRAAAAVSTDAGARSIFPSPRRFHGARAHAERTGVEAATEQAAGADGVVALGGGSAIDPAKAVSAATGLPLVSIPTTYAGAEWTRLLRDARRGDGDEGRRRAARTSPGSSTSPS